MKQIILAKPGTEISQREKDHMALARRAAAEGFVLLRNEGVLPLNTKKIALYGAGARKTVKGGTGSGKVQERHSVSIEEGLKKAGYQILTSPWLDRFDEHYQQLYTAWRQSREDAVKHVLNPMKTLVIVGQVPFTYPVSIPVEDQDVVAETDTAIFVIARQAGEGSDRSAVKGDWYLADVEYEGIKKVSQSYKNVIVVINAGGMLDLSFADEIPNIKSLIYYVQGGMQGGNAFADFVSGQVNPSGKLSATWAMKYEDYPNSATFSHNNGDTTHDNYTEGIYVGYRYFDSFKVKPRFPFGFGLSYTSFDLQAEKVAVEGRSIKLTVNAINTGSMPGREVVQVYVSAPFAEGKEYQRLVAFQKTGLIFPGSNQHIDLSFDLTSCASYDEKGARYLLDKGAYVVRVGNSSRHTTVAATLDLDEDVNTEKCVNICPKKGDFIDLAAPQRDEEDLASFLHLKVNPSDIEVKANDYHQLPVHYDKRAKQIVDKLSLKELCKLVVGAGVMGKRLVNVLGVAGSTTNDLYERHGIPNIPVSDGPAGLNVADKFILTARGNPKVLKIPAEYNFGFFARSLKHMVGSEKDGVVHCMYATAWPVGTLLAQTWDPDLITEVGRAVGIEMEEFGVTLWLAPGMNIHRNPLCGRNFEYFSEDPLISGKLAAAITRGVQSSEGKGTTIKHFCCNNQEDNRSFSSSNLSERALREIYLKGFEIAVKESQPMALMSSYNLINGVYSPNCHDTLTKVLRQEWDFQGMVMTDWYSCGKGKGDATKCQGAGNDLVMPGSRRESKAICKAVKAGKVSFEDVRLSAYRIMTVILRNTAYPMWETPQ